MSVKVKALNHYVLIKEDKHGSPVKPSIITMEQKPDDSGNLKLGTIVSFDEKNGAIYNVGDRVLFMAVKNYDKEFLGGYRIIHHTNIIAIINTPIGEDVKIKDIVKLVA